jgi:hypothetical protein
VHGRDGHAVPFAEHTQHLAGVSLAPHRTDLVVSDLSEVVGGPELSVVMVKTSATLASHVIYVVGISA